jgi:hypothetical protein
MKRLRLDLWAGRTGRAARIGITWAVVLLGLWAPAFADSQAFARQRTGLLSRDATKTAATPPASVAAPFPDQARYPEEHFLLENAPGIRQGFPNPGPGVGRDVVDREGLGVAGRVPSRVSGCACRSDFEVLALVTRGTTASPTPWAIITTG